MKITPTRLVRALTRLLLAAVTAVLPIAAAAQSESIGIVIMHGKGGSPQRLVIELAKGLEAKGFLVANLEMPWSGKRNYDVTTAKGEEEVAAALADLRAKGAKKVFVCGHSQGGVFALHLAAKVAADGFITIAPGGNVATRFYSEKIGSSLARARQLVAEGKGNVPTPLQDYEGSKDAYEILAVPAAYVTWFDPAGAMDMERAVRVVSPRAPVLWVAPTRDYPGLIKGSLPLYRTLPKNPLTRLYEPNADHRGAPAASVEEVARWTQEVANSQNK